MQTISLPLPEELLRAVDASRGDVPRTVWIRRAIEHRLLAEFDVLVERVAGLLTDGPKRFGELACVLGLQGDEDNVRLNQAIDTLMFQGRVEAGWHDADEEAAELDLIRLVVKDHA